MSGSLRGVVLGVEPVGPQILELLSRASTATLTAELFARGLRNTFLNGVRPLNPSAARFVGEAFTLRYIPAREDLDVVEGFANPEHPQRRAIESLSNGQVLVVDCRGQTEAGALGNMLVTRIMRRGAAAVVTDGSVRDSPLIAKMDFPVFCAGGAAPLSLTIHHAVDFQLPIGCGGVSVFPGDILVGDPEGVVAIPRLMAPLIAEGAVAEEELEGFLLEKIEQGSPLPGTYPPDKKTLAAYKEQREQGL
ncbi:MAG: ribonuclease activity regulator RraA [Acidimicrobiia bacterium]